MVLNKFGSSKLLYFDLKVKINYLFLHVSMLCLSNLLKLGLLRINQVQITKAILLFFKYFFSPFGSINQNVYFCTPFVQVGSKRGDVGFPPSGPK